MKRIFAFAAIGSICSLAACAQNIKESQVPSNVKTTFQKEFPNATAKWEKEKGNYEVNFKKDGKTMSALINKEGAIIETETDIATNELPQTVLSYLKEHYKGAKVTEAAKIVNEKGELNYEAEVNGKDVMFDANGKFIKEVKD